ncbi:substrate-binding periplasmic protein [Lacibacterium aquatile]|uniref:Substrate-binding periplasmic protein n=1 Tax=Lacibacterium aquatile TaxID=1168082 RepID=A0ABW5DXD0_9PROT
MTMFGKFLRIAILAPVFLIGSGSSTQALQFLTEEFPPYNYTKNGIVIGSATAVVRALAASLGETVSIEVLPWHRALEETAAGPDTMLFVGARTADREHRFKWIGPILKTKLVLLGRKGPEASWSEILDHANILVQAKGPCHELLTGLQAHNLETAMDELTNARKFVGGRSPLWCSSPDVLSAMLARTGNRFDAFEVKHVVGSIDGYILASPDIPDAEIQRWQDALDKMAANGTLATISNIGR